MTEAANEITAEEISAALDNSSETTVSSEPQNSDNSNSEDAQEPGEQAENPSAKQEENEDGENQEADDKPKFDTLEAALKGYSNLQKKLGEQSNELGELRKKAELAEQLQKEQIQIAQSYGFESVEDFKNAQLEQEYDQKLAAYEADLYAHYLDKCEFPEEMQKLLLEYRRKPNKETLELIEADFPVDVLKEVAGTMAIAKGQLQAQKQEAQKAQLAATAKSYLEENVSRYEKEFANSAFVELYGEAFKAYGCDLDTDRFVSLMKAYAKTIETETTVNNGISQENKDITSEIAGLVQGGRPTPPNNKDIASMSEKELAANIRKYI